MRKLLSACWVHALNACLCFLASTMFEMVCKISGNVSDRALKWTLSGGCSRHLSLGVRSVAPESTHFESYWASHPGVHSHQWGLWDILESLDKYSNKCSYLYMLANFYRLFINSLLPHSDQNFWFADGDNIWISGLGVLVLKMCHSGWRLPFNWYLTSAPVNCPWDQEDRDTQPICLDLYLNTLVWYHDDHRLTAHCIF